MHHSGSTTSNSGNTTTTVTRHLLIRGHVQGVGYRWSLVQAALQRGVQGWVRNRRDGSVEALATGPADAVQSLIDWARHGPPQARVDAVDVGTVAEPVAGFVQRETV